jgi:hypothetical protein
MFLGAAMPPGGGKVVHHQVPPHHLVTHGVVLGMTGSGKTGLLMVTVEEALRSRVPVILIDVKGDLPNLLLAFSSFEAAAFAPWVDGQGSPDEPPVADLAEQLAGERRHALGAWGLGGADLEAFAAGTRVRVLTPGSTAGEPVHILSSLERRSASWDTDVEAGRAAVSAAISLVLRLLGKDPDPARSREHALLSVLAERRMQLGQTAELGTLLDEVLAPPVERLGALDVDDFLPLRERRSLAAALNTLLASPTFASWRQGISLDIRDWLTSREGRTPAVIVSVAHLDDDERTLVLGVLLEEILAYTRSLPGTRRRKHPVDGTWERPSRRGTPASWS